MDIISPPLELFHSSHKLFPLLSKLFQAPLLKLEYLVLTHNHQTHWVTVELQGHFPCEIFPDLCYLPDLDTVDSLVPHTVLHRPRATLIAELEGFLICLSPFIAL